MCLKRYWLLQRHRWMFRWKYTPNLGSDHNSGSCFSYGDFKGFMHTSTGGFLFFVSWTRIQKRHGIHLVEIHGMFGSVRLFTYWGWTAPELIWYRTETTLVWLSRASYFIPKKQTNCKTKTNGAWVYYPGIYIFQPRLINRLRIVTSLGVSPYPAVHCERGKVKENICSVY